MRGDQHGQHSDEERAAKRGQGTIHSDCPGCAARYWFQAGDQARLAFAEHANLGAPGVGIRRGQGAGKAQPDPIRFREQQVQEAKAPQMPPLAITCPASRCEPLEKAASRLDLRRPNNLESALAEMKKPYSSAAQAQPPSPRTMVPSTVAAIAPLVLRFFERQASTAVRAASRKPIDSCKYINSFYV